RFPDDPPKLTSHAYILASLYIGGILSTTASGLLPAGMPIDVQRRRTELVRKSDIWFGYKALGLKETAADVLHHCQLGKLAVVTRYSRFHGNEGTTDKGLIASVTASVSRDRLVRQIPGERVGKVAGEIAAAEMRSAAMNDGRANPERRQQSGQLGLRQR